MPLKQLRILPMALFDAQIPVTKSPGTDVANATLAALGAIILYWSVECACQRLFFGPVTSLSLWGVQWALAHTLIILTGLLAGAMVVGRVSLFPRLVVWTYLLGCLINPLAWLWYTHRETAQTEREWYIVFCVQLLPQVLVLVWLLRGRGWRVLTGLVSAAAYVGAHAVSLSVLNYEPLVYAADAESDAEYEPLDVEGLYAAQDGHLSDQIAALALERPGRPDVFALLLGGTSYQSVFMSEVDKVGPILNAHYGSGTRTLRLVNSDEAPLRYPLANRKNLATALKAIADRMGPEDLAYVYMTSHGGKDVFSLSFPEAGTNDLTAPEFAAMLKDSRIGASIIVISACHAGSFIDDIKAPNRLIVAAARADRASFGCANGRDWTEFGESFFLVGMAQSSDPRVAFAIAAVNVRAKEFWSLRKASLPEMTEGATIGPILDRVLEDHLALAAD
jgi:Peptidase C13 family